MKLKNQTIYQTSSDGIVKYDRYTRTIRDIKRRGLTQFGKAKIDGRFLVVERGIGAHHWTIEHSKENNSLVYVMPSRYPDDTGAKGTDKRDGEGQGCND